MNQPILMEPATDWTGHTYADRFREAAILLYVHGLITAAEFQRLDRQLRRDIAAAAADRIRENAK